MIVGIFGSWRPGPDDEIYKDAYNRAWLIGHMGHRVLTGGYSGVMEAASRGAYESGGHTIGVTCPEISLLINPNDWITETIECESIEKRLACCIGMIDAAVFFPGRSGTISELALACELREKKKLAYPVVIYGSFWESFFDWRTQIMDDLPFSKSPEGKIYERLDTLEQLQNFLKT